MSFCKYPRSLLKLIAYVASLCIALCAIAQENSLMCHEYKDKNAQVIFNIDVYHYKISFNLKDSDAQFCFAYKSQEGPNFIAEYIPKGQTLDNWSKMLTLRGHYKHQITNEEFVHSLRESQLCSQNKAIKIIRSFKGGIEVIVACGSYENDRLTGGRRLSEVTHYLMHRVGDSTYIFILSTRGEPFDVSTYNFNNEYMQQSSTFLNKIKLIKLDQNPRCILPLPTDALAKPLLLLMPIYTQSIDFIWGNGKESFCITEVDQSKSSISLLLEPRGLHDHRFKSEDQEAFSINVFALKDRKNSNVPSTLSIEEWLNWDNNCTVVESKIIKRQADNIEFLYLCHNKPASDSIYSMHKFVRIIDDYAYVFAHRLNNAAQIKNPGFDVKRWSLLFHSINFTEQSLRQGPLKGSHKLFSKNNSIYIEVFGPDIY